VREVMRSKLRPYVRLCAGLFLCAFVVAGLCRAFAPRSAIPITAVAATTGRAMGRLTSADQATQVRTYTERALPERARLPLWIKVACTLFVCLLVPVYWRHYGPVNFLWFSDIALFSAVPALWLESPLLTSMMALSVLALEVWWNVDYLIGLILGRSVTGLSAYMFEPTIPRFIRGISLFHVALPLLIVWMLYRLGYDPRALAAQTLLAWVVLPITYLLKPSENINRIYGLGSKPQTRLPPPLHVILLMILFPVVVYLPTHFVLKKLFARPAVERPFMLAARRAAETSAAGVNARTERTCAADHGLARARPAHRPSAPGAVRP
jgi:hypothetical protein